MVSLEERLSYLSIIHQNIKLTAFYNMLQHINKKVEPEDDVSEIDALYYQFLWSILCRDKSLYAEAYKKISKRMPSIDSQAPYINNDLLIFPIIMGIKMFSIDADWVLKVLDVRRNTPTTITFKNILLENYDSKDNQQGVIITYLFIVNSSLINGKMFDEFYHSISQNVTLFEKKSDFEILTSLKAYDVLLLHKEIPPEGEFHELQIFEQKFLRIAKVIAFVINNIIFCSILLLIYKISLSNAQIRNFISELGTISSFLGLGIIVGLNLTKRVNKLSFDVVLITLGYPKKRLTKLHKSDRIK